MIVVYAGRLPSRLGGDFPHAHAPLVRSQLRSMIAGLRPRLVVGSAAAGADLLVLSVAVELADEFGIRCRVITAGNREDFEQSSVTDSGPGWVDLYHRVLKDTRHVQLVEHPVSSDDAGYALVNDYVLQLARDLRKPKNEPIVGIRVGPRQARQGLDHTAAFAQGLASESYPVLNVRTDLGRFPEAFVAMPFGKKEIPSRNWVEYDSDVTYKRILVPALIAAGFSPRRVDNDNYTEIIDYAMIRPLGDAPLVVGDLTTGNPNVFWELGVRHAWRKQGTTLVRLEGTRVPFDLNRVPVHEFFRGENDVSDIELVHSLQSLLDPFLKQASPAANACDSPVFTHLPTLGVPQLPDSLDPVVDDHVNALEREIESASIARSTEELRNLAGVVKQDQILGNEAKERLHGVIAETFISLGQLDDARVLLAPLADADLRRQNRQLQQSYAHTLIRGTTGNLDNDLRVAEAILKDLLKQEIDAETSGLLGSTAKVMTERALARNDVERVVVSARAAAKAYEEGFNADPRAYYPGVNVVALRRLIGQRWEPNTEDIDHVRKILPVVKFMTRNAIDVSGAGIWAQLTAAELDLHEYLLGDPDPTADAPPALARTFSTLNQLTGRRLDARRSFGRQLELMRAAGDPPVLIDQLIGRLTA